MANYASHKLSHTMIRGRTYYTNFRLNDSTSFVRLSLGTDSQKQAEVIMNQIRPYIPLVQNGTMGIEEFKRKIHGYRAATKQDFDSYLLRALERDVAEVERLPELGQWHKNINPDSPLSPSETVEAAQGYADAHFNRMVDGSELTANEVLASLHMQKIELSKADLPLANQVAAALDLSRTTVAQAYEAFYSKDLLRYRQITAGLQAQLEEAKIKSQPQSDFEPKQPVTPTAKEVVSQTITLSEAWAMYVKEKGQKWRRSIANENQRFFDVLLYVVGDKPIDLVTKQDIRQALKVTENLPTRIKLPYKHLSLKECIDYDVPEDDLLSSQHVEKHLKIWRSLFKTYLVDTKDLLERSPTDGVPYVVKPNRRGHYNPVELARLKTKLFSLGNADWRKWYFLALIYTGARRGELATIKKKDIRQDEETGRWYIFIEEGKTDHAQRQIPLHNAVEGGLLNLIKERKPGDLVFSTLPNYTATTDEWITIMEELCIPDYDEFGLKRRIHSLRHTFMSGCLASGVSVPLMQFVVGHSRSQSLGVTSIYTHRPPLKDLLGVVDFQK
ncbi:MAG TPA: tyrosine-type recombinase/integrase [Scandinavium sp.]|uniref:tyrosine-type recombinase/integrase n=1 Tax=Scandinavium sp. TaxID=2830653 RepID=UPI002E3175F9|nr:tyrosine-type recombinase/integrase [Scandinavium sp.]HEX4502355.1 tyrosine-type recombinase/integrase [Scandinavium sp.]